MKVGKKFAIMSILILAGIVAAAPTVTSLDVTSGPSTGGTAIVITGTGFVVPTATTSGSTVQFDSLFCAGTTTVTSATAMTCSGTPVGVVGAQGVTLTNPDGTKGTLASGFTYTSTATTGNYSAWSRYKDLTLSTSTLSLPNSDVRYIPVLVRFTTTNAAEMFSATPGSTIVQTNGADIRITKADGTTNIPYQVDSWTTGATGSGAVWVLLDKVLQNSATAYQIRVYWGNANASITTTGSGPAVFSPNNGYLAVWHMGGVNADSIDATGLGHTLTANGGTIADASAANSFIGNSKTLASASAQYYSIANQTDLNLNTNNGPFTITGWGTPSACGSGTSANRQVLISKYDNSNGSTTTGRAWAVQTSSTTGLWRFTDDPLWNTGTSSTAANAGYINDGACVTTAATNQVVGVYYGASTPVKPTTSNTGASQRAFIYTQGAVSGTAGALESVADQTIGNSSPVQIGRNAGGETRYFNGAIDEITISTQARAPEWIKLSYETGKPTANLWTLGTTQTTASVPGAPTAVTDSAGNGQVKVSWTAPASDGGSAITGYTVTASDTSKHCSTTSSLTCTVNGLTNGTSYTFTVTATNAIGTSAASSPSPSATPTAPPGAPSAPAIGTATAGVGQATITWSAATANGSAVTGYIVTSSPDGKTCSTTAALTCVDTALTVGTSYTFTVVATSAAGNSPASAASNAVTPTGVPGAPLSPIAKAGNALDTVSWTAPTSNGGSAITSYTATSTPGNLTCSTATLTCVVTGLTKGTSYTFTVKATNAVGAGPASVASNAAIPVSVPGAPGTPVAKAAIAGGADTVTWTAPADSGGAHISAYTVTASDTSKHCTTTGALTCVVAGLTGGTAYTFTVTATNSVGKGAASVPSGSVNTALASFFKDADIHFIASSTSLRLPAFSGVARVSMVDVWGREVWNKTVNSGLREISWNQNGRSSIAPGIYIVRMVIQDSNHKTVTSGESKILLTP